MTHQTDGCGSWPDPRSLGRRLLLFLTHRNGWLDLPGMLMFSLAGWLVGWLGGWVVSTVRSKEWLIAFQCLSEMERQEAWSSSDPLAFAYPTRFWCVGAGGPKEDL